MVVEIDVNEVEKRSQVQYDVECERVQYCSEKSSSKQEAGDC